MSDSISLVADPRTVTGSKVKNLRAEGFIPATIYQKGKESVSVQVQYQPFVKAYTAAGLGQPVELQVGKETRLAMIKEVDVDPARHTYRHIAFHAVRADRVVEAEIPVIVEGDAPAEVAGNVVKYPNDIVLVKAIPAKLPENITVSAELLKEAGDSITVADIKAIPDVEIASAPETQLAVAEEPRVVEEEPEETEVVDAADVPSDNGGGSDESSDSEEKSEE